MSDSALFIQPFSNLHLLDRSTIGGKNASLGEMIAHLEKHVSIPDGFVLTTKFFEAFLSYNNLEYLKKDHDLKAISVSSVDSTAQSIQHSVLTASLSPDMLFMLKTAYEDLDKEDHGLYAVRSSSIDEDHIDHSFAGQHDTALGVRGFKNIVNSIIKVFSSLFNSRALRYRAERNLSLITDFSIAVQKLVYDPAMCSGVLFTLDPETQSHDLMVISSHYGLGESVVSGQVTPDEYLIYKENLQHNLDPVLRCTLGTKEQMVTLVSNQLKMKKVSRSMRQKFTLTHDELKKLAHIGLVIENHYGLPMDIEWAKKHDDFYILQARPMTVKAKAINNKIQRYKIENKGKIIVKGYSVGSKITSGPVKIVRHVSELSKINKGDILVTTMTDLSWESVLTKVSGIVTNNGGRTCHAAIVARELAIPTLVGTGNATDVLIDGSIVTIDCSNGIEGFIYEGSCSYVIIEDDAPEIQPLPVELLINVSQPTQAFTLAQLPSHGVGLTRLEFIINNTIKIHPRALLELTTLPHRLQSKINKMIKGYETPEQYYLSKLIEGVGSIAAAFAPRMVVVRFSDLKSNEYRQLVGGHLFEPHEENPMLGYRGAARYSSKQFKEAFKLECMAINYLRKNMGFEHIWAMIPFVRTVEELSKTLLIMEQYGLKRGENNLKVLINCELPANIILAREFLSLVDGYSIGSNDLTQLTLGIDRDAGCDVLLSSFDERNPAVLKQIEFMLKEAKELNKYVSICGQAPSDHYDFTKFLIERGISSISLNPSALIQTMNKILLDPDFNKN